MGFTYTITGTQSASWPLTGRCVDQIERLRACGLANELNILFGPSTQEHDSPFSISLVNATASISKLLPTAKELPNGFEVWSPSLYGESRDGGGRGVGGLLINGKYHSIRCNDDYWVIGATEDLLNNHDWSRHYESRDITTDNHRVYQVKVKKGRSDLSDLLVKLQKFLKTETAEVVQAVFG